MGLQSSRPYMRRVGSNAKTACVNSSPSTRPIKVVKPTKVIWTRVKGRIFLYFEKVSEIADFCSLSAAPTLLLPVALFSFFLLPADFLVREPVRLRLAPPLRSRTGAFHLFWFVEDTATGDILLNPEVCGTCVKAKRRPNRHRDALLRLNILCWLAWDAENDLTIGNYFSFSLENVESRIRSTRNNKVWQSSINGTWPKSCSTEISKPGWAMQMVCKRVMVQCSTLVV